MKKLHLILIINCLLLIVNCYSQPVTQEWVRRFSGFQSGTGSGGRSIKLDSMGNIYVLAGAWTDSTYGDIGLLKYNSSGVLLWAAYYNSPENLDEHSEAFAITNDGDVYITGSIGINFVYHILTVKISSEGNVKWVKVFDSGGPPSGADNIAIDKYGNVAITGGAAEGNSSYSLVVKYNSNGDTLWSRKLTQLGVFSVTTDLVIDDSCNIYATGYYDPEQYKSHYLTLKYSTNGDLMWYSTYNYDPGYQNGSAHSIALDLDGNVYIVGVSSTLAPNYWDNCLVKINSNGVIQWARAYKGIGGNNACSVTPANVCVSADGERIYYSTACEDEWFSYAEFITLAYNSSGDSIWVRRFPIHIFGMPQYNPASLKLDRYNNIYIVGSVYYQTTSGDDYVTIKYLPNGTQHWVTTYNGPLINSHDHAVDLAVDTNLNVYVTGTSSRQNNPILWDAATIKYNQPNGITSNNNEVPEEFKLHQNYPNPFNSITLITYELPHRSNVKLSLYNITGQLVRTLVKSEQNTGYYSLAVNLDDLASGVYFYKIEVHQAGSLTESFVDTKKLVLLK